MDVACGNNSTQIKVPGRQSPLDLLKQQRSFSVVDCVQLPLVVCFHHNRVHLQANSNSGDVMSCGSVCVSSFLRAGCPGLIVVFIAWPMYEGIFVCTVNYSFVCTVIIKFSLKTLCSLAKFASSKKILRCFEKQCRLTCNLYCLMKHYIASPSKTNLPFCFVTNVVIVKLSRSSLSKAKAVSFFAKLLH